MLLLPKFLVGTLFYFCFNIFPLFCTFSRCVFTLFHCRKYNRWHNSPKKLWMTQIIYCRDDRTFENFSWLNFTFKYFFVCSVWIGNPWYLFKIFLLRNLFPRLDRTESKLYLNKVFQSTGLVENFVCDLMLNVERKCCGKFPPPLLQFSWEKSFSFIFTCVYGKWERT